MATYEQLPQTIGSRPELINPGLLSSLAASQASQFNAGIGLAGTELAVGERAREADMNRLTSVLGNLPGQIMQAKQFQTQFPVEQAKAKTELAEQQDIQNRINAYRAGTATGYPPSIQGTNISYPGIYIPQGQNPQPRGGSGDGSSGGNGTSSDQTDQQTSDQGSESTASTAAAARPPPMAAPPGYQNPQYQAAHTPPALPILQSAQSPVTGPAVGHAVFGTPDVTSATPAANPLAAKLASGMSQQEIMAQGGARWAGGPGAPPAPLPKQSHVTDASSPTPLDATTALANRAHVTPEEALAWYKQNVSTDAAHARQEFDPATGQATNRIIISHNPPAKGQPAKPDQPVHAQYILANPGAGDWMHAPQSGANPALAANPATALSAAAAAPAAQNIQQTIAQGAGLPTSVSPLALPRAMIGPPTVQPAPIPPTAASLSPGAGVIPIPGASSPLPTNPLASQLAAGNLSQADIINQGGPLWAGTRNAPQAPRGGPPLMMAPTALSRPLPVSTPAPTPTPQAATTKMTPEEYRTWFDNHPDIRDATDDNVKEWKDHLGGHTGEEVYNLAAQHPDKVIPRGKDNRLPGAQGGQASQQADFDFLGQKMPGMVDQHGVPYYTVSAGPYEETRLYWVPGEGYKTFTIKNEIGQEQDKEMMQASLKAGLDYDPGWSDNQKIAQYQVAMSRTPLPNTAESKDTLKRQAALTDLMDRGNELLSLIGDAKQPGEEPDFYARDLRSGLSQKVNDVKQGLSGDIGYATGQLTGHPIHPDWARANPQVEAMKNKFQEVINAAEAAAATRQPIRMTATTGSEKVEKSAIPQAIGSLSDETFPKQLRAYLTTQGNELYREIKTAQQAHLQTIDGKAVRAPLHTIPEAVYHAQLSATNQDGTPVFGTSAPGGSDATAFHVLGNTPEAARADYDKLPQGAHYHWPSDPPDKFRVKANKSNIQ